MFLCTVTDGSRCESILISEYIEVEWSRGPQYIDVEPRGRARENRCQTACKPGSVTGGSPRDGHSSGTPVTGRLVRPTRAAGRKPTRRSLATAPHRPYLVLLPEGFAMPHPLPGARCALTAPFQPCSPALGPGRAVCSLWHFPWGRPRRALPGSVSPWSPDFPPPRASGGDGGHPAVWPALTTPARPPGQAALSVGRWQARIPRRVPRPYRHRSPHRHAPDGNVVEMHARRRRWPRRSRHRLLGRSLRRAAAPAAS